MQVTETSSSNEAKEEMGCMVIAIPWRTICQECGLASERAPGLEQRAPGSWETFSPFLISISVWLYSNSIFSRTVLLYPVPAFTHIFQSREKLRWTLRSFSQVMNFNPKQNPVMVFRFLHNWMGTYFRGRRILRGCTHYEMFPLYHTHTAHTQTHSCKTWINPEAGMTKKSEMQPAR